MTVTHAADDILSEYHSEANHRQYAAQLNVRLCQYTAYHHPSNLSTDEGQWNKVCKITTQQSLIIFTLISEK